MFEVLGIVLFCALIIFLDKRYGLGSNAAPRSYVPVADDDINVAETYTDASYSYMEGNLFHIDNTSVNI